MRVVFTRVDERLIHGQVILGWTNQTNTRLIMAVNDEVAANPLQKNLLKLGVKPGVQVEIISVAEAIIKIQENAWGDTATMVLVRNPIDLRTLIQAGLPVTKVNVGGVRDPEASIVLTKEVKATPEELEAWKDLDKMGVQIDIQFVPDQSVTNLNKVLKSY
mgnify:CR=1 FL=1